VTTQNRKLKLITFTLGGNSFECQVKQWNIANNSDDGEKLYAFCPDGEFREEAEPDYALELTFFSDWRSNGVSDYLTVNDQQTVAFVLDHHPDLPAEHVRWSGNAKIKCPSVGGEARTTEMTEITMPIIGKPTYLHL
jgi:hypothetical protein